VLTRYVYGTSMSVPDYMIRDGQTYKLVTDQLGSVRRVVNATTGDIAQELDYDPYGVVVRDTAPGFQPFGFTSGLYDHRTGLVRLGARDYDPETGRWTTKDPIGFAGGDTGLYNYVAGDPVNFTDPTGLLADAPLTKPKPTERKRGSRNASADDRVKASTGGCPPIWGPIPDGWPMSDYAPWVDVDKPWYEDAGDWVAEEATNLALSVEDEVHDVVNNVGELIETAASDLNNELYCAGAAATTTGVGFLMGGPPGAAVGAVGAAGLCLALQTSTLPYPPL
jgi:RHS repeat-associated protein